MKEININWKKSIIVYWKLRRMSKNLGNAWNQWALGLLTFNPKKRIMKMLKNRRSFWERCIQWCSEGPAGPATAGGPAGLKEPARACQEEVVAVTPWPGAQTSCWRGPENRRYATGYIICTTPTQRKYPHSNQNENNVKILLEWIRLLFAHHCESIDEFYQRILKRNL